MTEVTTMGFGAVPLFAPPSNTTEPIPYHRYTYITTDLRNNTVLSELPLQGVSYSRKLSGIGEFDGKLVVNDQTSLLDLRTSTAPGKTGMYILRDDEPVWGGILWKRNYDSNSRAIKLSGETFESYFYHRLQLTTKYWANEDQLEIARWLVNSNGSADDMLIEVSDATSSRRRERTMFGYEFKTTGTELEQLSGLIDGFDWNVEIYRKPDFSLGRKLEFYYPQAGVSREESQLFFEFPGAVKNFTLNEDADNSGNSIWAIGAGEGTEQVTANSQDTGQLINGWPLLELSRSYKSVLRPSTLQSHADSDRDRLTTPVTVFEVKVRSDAEPAFGTYTLGDWARFKLEDRFITPALDTYARITGISVDIDDSSGLETVSLTLGGDEVSSDG